MNIVELIKLLIFLSEIFVDKNIYYQHHDSTNKMHEI